MSCNILFLAGLIGAPGGGYWISPEMDPVILVAILLLLAYSVYKWWKRNTDIND